jgi:DNA (cytosine-5)-methyltransferase 1
MKFISLFTGIGGFDLGFERAGMQCVGQVEYNSFCQQVLKKYWPNVKLIGDIRDVTAESFESADLICGGFPCQPFSTAGSRKGKKDSRYLWPEMLRVIKAYKPTWVVGENVKGLITIALDTVCNDLEKEGYSVQSMCLPACAIGAVHRRERLFILAHSASNGQHESPSPRSIVSANGSWWEKEQEENSEYERCSCFRDVLDGQSTEIGSWGIEPPEIRVDDGIPNRMDRNKSIGNSVSPQMAEIIGRAILRAHSSVH